MQEVQLLVDLNNFVRIFHRAGKHLCIDLPEDHNHYLQIRSIKSNFVQTFSLLKLNLKMVQAN